MIISNAVCIIVIVIAIIIIMGFMMIIMISQITISEDLNAHAISTVVLVYILCS